MEARDSVLLLLKQHNCQKLRTSSREHPVYRLPNGSTITLPANHKASDIRSWNNALSTLRVQLGISHRGRVAPQPDRAKRRHKPGASYTRKIQHEQAQVATFGDKVRAALQGEPLRPQLDATNTGEISRQGETHPATTSSPEPSPRRSSGKIKVIQRASSRSGPVHVWSKEEIDAANRAASAGKLSEFMQRHDQAISPESKLLKEDGAMQILEVSAIDSTVAELRVGIEAAHAAAAHEQRVCEDFERQREDANQRRLSAIDKANSLQETIASLELARESLVKVRPMLGLLVSKPGQETVRRTRVATGGAVFSVVEVLRREQRPLTPRELHTSLRALPGFDTYTINAVYALLMKQKKKNGEAMIRPVGDGRYGLTTEVPLAVDRT